MSFGTVHGFGNISLVVDASGATGGPTGTFFHDVAGGLPVGEAIQDICAAAGLNYLDQKTGTALGQPKFKITIDPDYDTTYTDALLGKSWAEQGVHEGATIKVVDNS